MSGGAPLNPLPSGSPQQIAAAYDSKRRLELLQNEFDAYKLKYNDKNQLSLENELNGIADRLKIDHFHFEDEVFKAIEKLVDGNKELTDLKANVVLEEQASIQLQTVRVALGTELIGALDIGAVVDQLVANKAKMQGRVKDLEETIFRNEAYRAKIDGDIFKLHAENTALQARVGALTEEARESYDYILLLGGVILDVPRLLTSLMSGEAISEEHMKIRRPVILDSGPILGANKTLVLRHIESFDVQNLALRAQLIELAGLRKNIGKFQMASVQTQIHHLLAEGIKERGDSVKLQNEIGQLKLLLKEQEALVEAHHGTIQSLLIYSNVIQGAIFDATNQLKYVANENAIPDDKKIIRRPAMPEPGAYLENNNKKVIAIIGEFEVAIGALQTKLASDKQSSVQMNAEIARQKGEIGTLKTDIDRLSKPAPAPLLLLGDSVPPPVQAEVVNLNAEVKTLKNRIQMLEDAIVDKNNDLYKAGTDVIHLQDELRGLYE
jgi:hypothetical protein